LSLGGGVGGIAVIAGAVFVTVAVGEERGRVVAVIDLRAAAVEVEGTSNVVAGICSVGSEPMPVRSVQAEQRTSPAKSKKTGNSRYVNLRIITSPPSAINPPI
jgi:hypothetical protein